MKCRRRQATDPQKFKKIVNGRFFVFLLVEAEAIGVEAEAIGVEAKAIDVEAEAFEKQPLPHPCSKRSNYHSQQIANKFCHKQ